MVASTTSTTSAPITFSGLASGVDTSSIVQKLIAADQQPVTALQNQETAATNRLKAYSQLNTMLTTLKTSVGAMNLQSEVRTTTANVAASAPFTATSNNAYTGSYNISVSQLAQVQKDISTGFASNASGVLGTGTITIGQQVIAVNSSNNSLTDLMASINQVSGTTGVTASIINDGSTGSSATPYHLVLTGQDASTTFTVSSSLLDSHGNTVSLGGDSIESTGYSSDTSNSLGTGTVTIGNQVITLDSSNNTLQGLQLAINGLSGTGITASIINDGSSTNPYHLILTSQDGSTTPTFTSTLKDSQGKAVSLGFDSLQTVQKAQQAKLNVDGLNVVSNSNTVTGAISGITLNLNAVSAVTNPSGSAPVYATSQLSIVPDTSTLETNIQTFVTNYNAIMNWITAGYSQATADLSSTTAIDPSTAASPTDAQLSQTLIGDSTVNGIKRQLQSILSGSVSKSTVSGTLNNLSQIGISTNQDGTLKVDTPTLENALKNNFSGVTNLLAGDSTRPGVMDQYNTYLLQVTDVSQGMYTQKRANTRTTISRLDNQIATKTAALNKEQATLTARFNAMELMISNMNSQSSYITALYNATGLSTSSSSSKSGG